MATKKYLDLTGLERLKGKIEAMIPNISGKEDKTNKVTSISSSSTDEQYPSAKCVYDIIGDIESLLSEV